MKEKNTLTFTVSFFKTGGQWYCEETIEIPQSYDLYELRKFLYQELDKVHPTLIAVVIDERIEFPLMRCANGEDRWEPDSVTTTSKPTSPTKASKWIQPSNKQTKHSKTNSCKTS